MALTRYAAITSSLSRVHPSTCVPIILNDFEFVYRCTFNYSKYILVIDKVYTGAVYFKPQVRNKYKETVLHGNNSRTYL